MSFYYPDDAYNKTTYDLDRGAYGNPYNGGAQPQYRNQAPYPPPRQQYPSSFMAGLCKCGGPCVEAFCCYYCQISRQYNVIFNEKKGMNCGIFLLLLFLDMCVLDAIGMICQCYLRGRLRKRYNMESSCCGDCCTVLCCTCCALSQTHWELAMRGDDPGATCACGEADVPMNMR